MKFDKKSSFDIEDIESQLIDLRNLTELLYDYFKYSQDYIEENPFCLFHGYRLNASLTSAIIDVIDDTQEMINYVQNNEATAKKAVAV